MNSPLRQLKHQQELGPIVVQRTHLPGGIRLVIAALALLTVLFLIVLPIAAIFRFPDPATSASVIQAVTSWYGSALAVGAGAVAALAYRNSVQRPDLALRIRTSPVFVELRITNEGVASAVQPVVSIRFTKWGLEAENASGWRPVDWNGDGFWSSFTWSDESVVLHPGFGYDVPAISFPMPNPFEPSATLSDPYVVHCVFSWSGGGALLKTQEATFELPFAR